MSELSVGQSHNTHKRTAMFALIEQHQASGLSAKSFCKEHNIAPGTFYYWKKKHNNHHGSGSRPAEFIPIRVVNSHAAANNTFAEIIFANGNLLRLHSHVDAHFLSFLVS